MQNHPQRTATQPPSAWLRPVVRKIGRAWSAWRGKRVVSSMPVVEEYEARVMYSVDVAPQALLLAAGTQPVEQRVMDAQGDYVAAHTAPVTQGVELIIVDGAVDDKNTLLNQIDRSSGRAFEIIVLDAASDGISQISTALAGRSDVAALHIVSHGADGELQLGSTWLDASQLAARSAEIARWGDTLSDAADILLYGCDVAADAKGEAFVRQLSALTRADVAASSNLTGNVALGGDWKLEFGAGEIEHTLSLHAAVGDAWTGLLATFTVTSKSGSGAGTLVQAIADANASIGADVIEFQVSGSGAQIINVSAPLVITDAVTIDGTRNNGALVNGGGPGIILDGGALAANGLTLANGSGGSVIRGLVIRDFDGDGVQIQTGANGITLAGNHVGNLWEDGTRAGSNVNTGAGIHIQSLFNIIGGTGASDGNLISGNAGDGIWVENPAGSTVLVANNAINGNTIGVEGNGFTPLPNANGLHFTDGAQWDLVYRNFISRNTGSGVLIGDTGAVVHDVLIGDAGGNENTISFNGGDGVTVVSGIHNAIMRNSIFSNTGLGIDLRNGVSATGLTTNDGLDGDSGGNELQNYPVLTSAQALTASQVRVIGTLNSTATDDFLLDFYSNTGNDGSGHGEGETYLGSVNVTTDGSGNASFNTVLTASVTPGQFISATATNFYTIIIVSVRGSTSEFSANVLATAVANNAPALANGSTLNYTENGAAAAINTAIAVSDTDTTTLTSGTVAVTGNFAAGEDVLGFVANAGTMGNIAGSYAAGTGIMTLTSAGGTATLAQWQTALRAITYVNSSNNPSTLARTVSYQVNDGRAVNAASNTLTSTVNVTAVSDPIVAANGAITGIEDTPYLFAWSDFNVTDADGITAGTAVRMTTLPASGVLEYFNGNVWAPVALGQLFTKSDIDASLLRFRPTADESGYNGYPTPGVGNLRQDYAQFSFTPVQTQVLAIANPDGEANGLAEGAFQNPAAGWITSGADAGAQNLTAAEFALDHDASLYVNAGARLTQTLAATFSSARNYSLSFEFGWRSGVAYPTEPGFTIELYAGATLLGVFDETSLVGQQGRFVAGVLAIDGSLSGAISGTPLQIRLNGTLTQANFDNLKLVSYDRTTDIGAAATMTIDITPVNDAPTATNLNTAETYTEDSALNLTDIVISDIDSANVTAILTLSNPAAGSLNTATSGAVTSTYVAGTGVWTASGAIANVNTLLAGVTFTPTANFNASFTIASSVSDGVAAPITGSKAITGTAVNDAPVLAAGSILNYTENGAAAAVNGLITVSDVDNTTLSSATVGITGNFAAGQDVLGFTNVAMGNITGSYNAGSGLLTLTSAGGTATLAEWQAALRAVTYSNSSDAPSTLARTVTYRINDGQTLNNLSNVVGNTINVTAVNDAPTATNLNTAETYTEDTALNLTDIVISDIDSPTVTATLTLSNLAAGSLNTATAGAVTSTYIAATGVWTASGALANVNTLLAGVTFTPTANFNAGFTIATSVSDGVAAPITGSKAITGAAVNDAPTATNLNTAETYTEDTALNLTDIVISDIDSANVTATLTLSNPAAGSLNTATSGAVTSTYVAGTGVWTAIGALANVNTLLAGVTFTPTANLNASFTIATSVSDGVAAPITGSKAITGTAVNDAPTASNLNINETYVRNASLNLADIVITDVDSAVVTATLTLTDTAAGSLNTATSGLVTSTYNPLTGVWAASGAIANVNDLLSNVTFTPALNVTGTFTIVTNVSDGAASIGGTKVMTGIAFNVPPTATDLNTAETYTEDTALTLADIVIADADSPTVGVTLRLSDASAGSLSVGLSGAVTSTYDAATATWSASGAIADVNNLLHGLTFTPTADYNANFVIASSVSDGVAVAITGVKNISGVAVNDAPVAAAPVGLGTSEQVLLNLKNTGFSVSDVDSAALNATVTLSVTEGTLTVTPGGSGAIVAGSGTSVATISGKLFEINNLLNSDATSTVSYINNSDTPASPAILTLTVSDNGNIGGGALTSSADTLIDITLVNDAPTTSGVTLTAIAKGSGARLITQAELLANASDVDGPALTATGLAISSGGGSLIDNGDGTWTYTPLAADDTAVDFVYDITDGALAVRGNAALDILPVNGAPVNTVPGAQTVNEDTRFTLAGISVVDVDGDLATTQMVVTHGTLNVSLAGGAVISSGANGSTTLTLAGTQTQINAALSTLSYQGVADYNGADSLTVTSSDSAATPLSSVDTISIAVAPVNDLPAAADHSVITQDTSAVVMTLGDLGYSDPDGDALAKIKIVALPGSGALVLDGVAVALNQEIAAADIAAGKFQFVPTAGAAQSTVAAFAFQVNDGTAYSAASNTFAVQINATLVPGPALTTPSVATNTPPATVQPTTPTTITSTTPQPATPAVPSVGSVPEAAVPRASVDALLGPSPLILNANATEGTPRIFGFAADNVKARTTASDNVLQFGKLLGFTLDPLAARVDVAALRAPEAANIERASLATNSTAFISELNRVRESVKEEEKLEQNVVVSSVVAGVGMSVGYVFWLVRGGLLLTSLLSSLPAWRFVDPLPVLGSLKGDDEDDDDDESLESMVNTASQPDAGVKS